MNRGRYGQRHRCSGVADVFYIGCQKYGITEGKKLATAGELLTLQSDLEPIPVGVIGAASLDTDSAQKPERTRST
ncbi:hypothetical protein AHX05_09885 [Salmonella enterica subsp. indica]|uniref:Uncharacterized protein n=1 Tax=Salmonella enterica TaxID=28901 RepID=A0A702EFC5_SALER|nr:hypothetical protein [Salmonella enterica subsp. indica]ECC3875431.1 hypothetical protein [Salmonella enterica subsp. indica]ECG1334789.1 hypothetical protein [Salmonella enterica subsp. indica]HAC6565799.1 hypothetical protein [Salmonella enterica subsp. indica]HAC6574741.1 hypothetical protein [Salmonella enterica subsp. indica]